MSRDIIWAIDFSTQDFEKQNSVFPLAKQFAQAWDCKVQPVFVLNNKILRTDIDSYLMLQNVEIEDLEEAVFENFSLEDKSYLKSGKLLLSRSYTRQGLVKSLLEYSEEEQARAIMCCTRTRSKYYPSFLGGFTETLLNTSTIPTISMHPELNSEPPIKSIVYATDLEEENDTNFNKIISVAQKLNAKVNIFFNPEAISQSLYLAPQFPSQKVYQTITENDQKIRAQKEKRGQNLAKEAISKGVQCGFFTAQENPIVDESILEFAKESKADLIAMSSKMSRIEGALFGSICKEVLRRAECPVWAIHQ